MLWRTLGALLLGAVVAVGVARAVLALGSAEDPRPPGAIELAPDPDPGHEVDAPTEGADPVPAPGADTQEPAVVIPPPVHLDPAPAPPPPAPPAPAPQPPAPAPAPPAPAPPPDVDDDLDDDADDDVDDVDDDD